MEYEERIASSFYDSFYKKKWNGSSSLVRQLSIDQAYHVQDLVTKKRIASGEKALGFKVGCTSAAIRKQFGLTEPIHGKLFCPHITENQAIFDFSNYMNCAIEPEMVLKIGKDLQGINLTNIELIEAIAYVSPGIEIHEFNFWIMPPTIQELICSGGIHTGLIIGSQKTAPHDLSFNEEEFRVYKNKELVVSDPAREIMGGPLNSLKWLVNSLTERGMHLEKGSFVIPGSPVELINIEQNSEVTIEIDKVGSLSTYFKKN
ncbi:2-keto-4-pentenoate hydratase [Cyclobacterium jeungdonense]|uniref:Uncharacterized protein n=1 Tax=Cyclobacterium jeungdonense TaxID=708087 RepID=A0ABT8CB68_9BACT|nr:hypothetical protein [Cyclobacterium jeungdonense]MDN3689337.1 hypothetical protein [Cyclobacterium jeungdonense]